MLKHEKLPSTNSTKSGTHYNFAKIQENNHTPETETDIKTETGTVTDKVTQTLMGIFIVVCLCVVWNSGYPIFLSVSGSVTV